MDAFMQYGVVAGMQAMRDSGLTVTEANSQRIGVLMGSGMGGLESIEETYDKYLETHSPKKVSPFFIPASIINLVSGHLSIAFNLTGPNLAVATACTTSTHAIGLAMRLIQYGDADAMLAGGSEMATCVTGMSGFAQAKALSQRNDDPQGGEPPVGQGSRRLRDGRRRRRDDARGVRAGQGARRENLRRGRRLRHERRCLPRHRAARERRGRAQGDGQRARPTRRSIPTRCSTSMLMPPRPSWAIAPRPRRSTAHSARPPTKLAVSSTKSMTGHLLGAAGVVEAIFSRAGAARPSRAADHQFGSARRGLRSRLRAETARQMAIEYALSNSFGFGGTNGSLIFRRI